MDNHQHKPRFYRMLRSDNDDRIRAAAFDEWVADQPEPVRNQVVYWLACLDEAGYTETCCKSILAMLIIFLGAEPTEQDRMVAHGEAVRAAYEWQQVTKAAAVYDR